MSEKGWSPDTKARKRRLANRLIKLAEGKGYRSAKSISELTGIPMATINEWRRGDRLPANDGRVRDAIAKVKAARAVGEPAAKAKRMTKELGPKASADVQRELVAMTAIAEVLERLTKEEATRVLEWASQRFARLSS